MSWDAVILRIRGPFRPAREVAELDYLPLGSFKAVAAAIQSAFPRRSGRVRRVPTAPWTNTRGSRSICKR